ncbi:hypothetical protein BH09PSE4_BH09PSE4_20350 [soil metagenome]
MDALVAAFVAALLLQAGDRIPWFTAILADRYRSAGGVLAASAIAISLGYGAAALIGRLLSDHMSPNAATLFLAFALVSAGGSGLFALKPPARFDEGKGGGFVLGLIGILSLLLGDRTQFPVAALAARSPQPAFAAVGATLGTFAVVLVATLAGEQARKDFPMRAFRVVTGVGCLVVGLVIGIGALRLI